jgi:hypothetical protein
MFAVLRSVLFVRYRRWSGISSTQQVAVNEQFGEGTFLVGPSTTNDHGSMIGFRVRRLLRRLSVMRESKA